ncbi:carbon-nitrogen hydrolase [Alicyclobacillus cellulosilyticus]|uniref:Carbon-nitrogen hydrolase n=1 Tax=Alicyclobacillus cellulosilyticus TaxID=1003997 RepID=A0A917KAA1_9BACL|nr:nitrilase-related carbon-nitrogen hydrolase [Alicyclobacillus cellulosilyticus]GGJ06241.1 carbon-nitrogen hydrolase [Alicyclobacillus cellulosilyticus]
MARTFKVALGQVRPVLGDVAANVEKHLAWAARAREEGASLIVFPELGLTGYQVQDLTLDVARPPAHPDIQRLVAASQDLDIVFSFVEESDEHLFYVACAYAAEGRMVALHRKVFLPTYGMFDEGRYVAPGRRFAAFPTRFGRAGMLICEDAWHLTSPYLLALDGAHLLILPASSPARSVQDEEGFGSQSFWRKLLEVYARLLGVHILFVNRVGFEDGVGFFGGSFVMAPDGERIAEAPVLQEALVTAEVDLTLLRRVRYTTPILRDEKPELVLRALERWLVRRDASAFPARDEAEEGCRP